MTEKPKNTDLSKTQIDHLGERLKLGHPTEEDLRILDQHRLSYGLAYRGVVETLRQKLQLEPTGRPAKSTPSIIDKLRRERIRFSQMQDIAGCRVVVPNIVDQERIIPLICDAFKKTSIFDRRSKASHGYRAVHIVVTIDGYRIEIQVRTGLQHSWAEISEKLSDGDPMIKYGGGDVQSKKLLEAYAGLILSLETSEKSLSAIESKMTGDQIKQLKESMATARKAIPILFERRFRSLSKEKRK